jgi:hypothetical protein
MDATGFKFDSAWANHQVEDVLPLVPVTASTVNRLLGSQKKALAINPLAAFRPP